MLTTRLLALVSIVFLSNCSTLRKVDIQAVEGYAQAAESIAETPAQIFKQYYSLREEPLLLKNSVSFACDDNFKKNIAKTETAYETIAGNKEVVEGYQASFSVLTSFSKLLHALTDAKYRSEFVKQNDAFKIEFDSLVSKYNTFRPNNKIPGSVTDVATKILNVLSDRVIKSMQKKYLTELLTEAEPAIKNLCTYYIDDVVPELSTRMDSLDKELKNDFDEYIMNLKGCDSSKYHDPMLYKEKIIPVYLDWKMRQDKLQKLLKASKTGMQHLSDGCKAVLLAFKNKTKRSELIEQLKELYQSANDIRKAYKTYNEDRQKLKEETQPKN